MEANFFDVSLVIYVPWKNNLQNDVNVDSDFDLITK